MGVTRPSRRRRDRCTFRALDDRANETGLLGILNVMLLLVPALLLMAHVTAHTSIVVSTPWWGGDRPADVKRCDGGPLLEVAITHDGFFMRSDATRWQRVGAPAAGLDHRALAATAREWKSSYPHETVALVSAEDDITYATLVATLDTLRGPDCRLAGAEAGEAIPDECLLWRAIIRDRASNHHVPAFRRGLVWPPPAGHTLDAGSHAP